MEKMTKKQMYAQILTNYELTQEEQDFINHEIELLSKKNSKSGKPTKTQIENTHLMDVILEKMESNTQYTATDIQILLDNHYSNQKVTHLMKNLLDTDQVTREELKGKAYYTKKD